ncbi:MAG: ribonuclease J [Candidatus Borkfalkiaceae bacterium]|nr:ribonuclease J [Christensenellaceae bacterium]
MKNKSGLKVRFLGGVGEIGKNMTALEYGKDIIVIDAGLTFPSAEMPGIDQVIPDITYLMQNKDRVRGIFLTHGHEDHIGGLPYVLKDLNVPVYGTKLTLMLCEHKLKEQRVNGYKLNCVSPGTVVKAGCFAVEFIHVNHSIPGSCALSVSTPVGVVFHSGDFKIDMTPINGQMTDLPRISEIGKKGVTLLLCESTNVEQEGYTMSEMVVGETLDALFRDNAKRRIIVATFATNVHRLQQIVNLAEKHKRKIAFSGRSMLNVVEAATKVGEISIPQNMVVDIEKIKNVADKDLVIVSTGSQGEPMSALTRMAAGDYNQVQVGSNDTIIISASPIPGNEKSIYQVINNLYRKGAEVVYKSIAKIHVSGHACQEELKILHTLLNPRFFIPVHGEYRHLKKHCRLAKAIGMKEANMLIADIGDTVEVTSRSMKRGERFQSGSRYIDGLSIDDTETVVRDRKRLAEDGLIVAVCCISEDSGEIVSDPDIINKGSILSDAQVKEAKSILVKTLNGFDMKAAADKSEVRNAIRKNLRNYIMRKTKKNPMILPVITEV